MGQEETKPRKNSRLLFQACVETFCFILLCTGVFMILFFIENEITYDPTSMQNVLILTVGCFGSYVFLAEIFFKEERNQIITRHITVVLGFLLGFGILALYNLISNNIAIEDMVDQIPLVDSMTIFLLFFFAIIFPFVLGYRILREKSIFSSIEEILEVKEEEE